MIGLIKTLQDQVNQLKQNQSAKKEDGKVSDDRKDLEDSMNTLAEKIRAQGEAAQRNEQATQGLQGMIAQLGSQLDGVYAQINALADVRQNQC